MISGHAVHSSEVSPAVQLSFWGGGAWGTLGVFSCSRRGQTRATPGPDRGQAPRRILRQSELLFITPVQHTVEKYPQYKTQRNC